MDAQQTPAPGAAKKSASQRISDLQQRTQRLRLRNLPPTQDTLGGMLPLRKENRAMTLDDLIAAAEAAHVGLNTLMVNVQDFASGQQVPPALQGAQDKLREAAYACELARNRLAAHKRDITPAPVPEF